MKARFVNNQQSCFIEIIPETAQEANQLMDFAANSKVGDVDISYHFVTDRPRAEVFIKKVNPMVKYYGIRNRKLKNY